MRWVALVVTFAHPREAEAEAFLASEIFIMVEAGRARSTSPRPAGKANEAVLGRGDAVAANFRRFFGSLDVPERGYGIGIGLISS